ncbi:hypothetical protein TrST_g5387 [Triparma strigata]|uniref:U-box domain-containing protein n=1 Tax=Triparma strigata TaxID=1606541 RepID=A0A9W7C0P8_9STRA|nr:hypothetical protein TrST_g5387 [Triparma strigata]
MLLRVDLSRVEGSLSIGNLAFANCEQLEEVLFPKHGVFCSASAKVVEASDCSHELYVQIKLGQEIFIGCEILCKRAGSSIQSDIVEYLQQRSAEHYEELLLKLTSEELKKTKLTIDTSLRYLGYTLTEESAIVPSQSDLEMLKGENKSLSEKIAAITKLSSTSGTITPLPQPSPQSTSTSTGKRSRSDNPEIQPSKRHHTDMFAVDPEKFECPKEFECPIAVESMEDPVFAADGHSYERSEITAWLINHNTSPMTNDELEHRW